MRLSGLAYAAVRLAEEAGLDVGKTTLQKILFFALPDSERESYYEPYFYGPYSKSIQMIAERLCVTGYIRYDEESTRFALVKKISLESIETDPPEQAVLERIRRVVEFLKEHGMDKTSAIAFLSKMFYFNALMANKDEKDTHAFIRQKSKLFDWREVVSAKRDKMEYNLELARSLRAHLDSPSHA